MVSVSKLKPCTAHSVEGEVRPHPRRHNFILCLSFFEIFLNVSDQLANFFSPIWMMGAVWVLLASEGEGN